MKKINIKEARMNAKVTMKEAAELIGVSASTISKWEKGSVSPTIFQAINITKAYGVPMESIDFALDKQI